jgi:hypothetical protein
MFGSVKYFVHRRFLYDLPQVHHDHVIRHFRNHSQIVSDQHDGHAVLFLKPPHQV